MCTSLSLNLFYTFAPVFFAASHFLVTGFLSKPGLHTHSGGFAGEHTASWPGPGLKQPPPICTTISSSPVHRLATSTKVGSSFVTRYSGMVLLGVSVVEVSRLVTVVARVVESINPNDKNDHTYSLTCR